MTETTTGAARFALDEDKAREWIARAIAQAERGDAGEHIEPDASLPAIPASYRASSGDWAHATARLVQAALDAGIISDPLHRDQDTLAWEFSPSDGMGEAGYRWLLYADVSDEAAGHMIVTTATEGMWGIGLNHENREIAGTESALSVLRDAVTYGNALADDLARYVASLPLAVRAPEVGQLLAELNAAAQADGSWPLATGVICDWFTRHGYFSERRTP